MRAEKVVAAEESQDISSWQATRVQAKTTNVALSLLKVGLRFRGCLCLESKSLQLSLRVPGPHDSHVYRSVAFPRCCTYTPVWMVGSILRRKAEEKNRAVQVCSFLGVPLLSPLGKDVEADSSVLSRRGNIYADEIVYAPR